jgi:Xaa-Pro dipeptidase
MALAPPTDIPERADVRRMHRDRSRRLRALMREQGLDALVLLGNTNVVYATGAIWPLADSGRANFEQPVAVVTVDDEWPHLFSPLRAEDRLRVELPEDHIHGPVYLDFDEGVQLFASQLAEIVPPDAVVALDEWTNALRRERSILFGPDAPADGGRIISRAKAVKTPDELACMREGRDVPAHDLRGGCRRQHPRPDLAGDAFPDGRRTVDDDRRSGLPAPVDGTRAR